MKPYTDYQYAGGRMAGTIVMHGETPVEVRTGLLGHVDAARHERAGGPIKAKGKLKAPIYVRDLKTNTDYMTCISELIPEVPELGYVNYQGVASYLVRLPKRRDWRQGIRYSNLRCVQGLDLNLIPYSSMCDTLTNVYPTFEKCLNSFKRSKTLKSIAWHRDWAVSRAGEIYFQGEAVGTLNEGRVVLYNECKFLQESLDESGV